MKALAFIALLCASCMDQRILITPHETCEYWNNDGTVDIVISWTSRIVVHSREDARKLQEVYFNRSYYGEKYRLETEKKED